MIDLLAGTPSLLIALPQLQDPNFVRSVVLLLEHDDQGAMGFVINRIADYTLKDILHEDNKLKTFGDAPAWIGGPIQTDRAVVLHNCQEVASETSYGDIKVSSSAESLEELLDMPKGFFTAKHAFRFIVGYAGWGAGQLSAEIRGGAWIQTDFDHEIVFNTDPKHMWTAAMQILGINPLELVHSDQRFIN
ncbi:MAG: YqgE/AlgH family protein [Pseudobacteriovorax sp.]|nr:YqgE/AlgH family protein [Pseudobacteriovorax sp.]